MRCSPLKLRSGILGFLAILFVVGVLTPLISRANASKPVRPVFDSKVLDEQIEFHESRVSRDPTGAIGYQMLSNAYLNRARETQTPEDAARAEAAARKSLQIRKRANAAAYWRLGQALMQQHRFREALATSRAGLVVQPGFGSCIRLATDALIELGELENARTLIRENPTEFPATPIGLSIKARLFEASGSVKSAIASMQTAVQAVDQDWMLSSENVAWYHTKLGQMLSASGNQQAADEHFSKSLTMYPRDWKALIGRARVALIDGRSRDAVPFLNQAGEIVALMEVPSLLVEAFADLGDTDGVRSGWDRLQLLHDKEHFAANVAGAHTHDRQYAEILLHWNRNVADALTLAQLESKSRQDATAVDLLAWALFRNGNLGVAMQLSQNNRGIGKISASRLFHQGMIFARGGNARAASEDLARALDLGLLPSERSEADRELKGLSEAGKG